MNTDFSITLLALLGFGVLGVVSFQRHFREHNSVRPRMVPWMIIAMACLATEFMLAVHLVNVLGFETGQR